MFPPCSLATVSRQTTSRCSLAERCHGRTAVEVRGHARPYVVFSVNSSVGENRRAPHQPSNLCVRVVRRTRAMRNASSTENLFDRAKALKLDWDDGRVVLERYARTNQLLGKPLYGTEARGRPSRAALEGRQGDPGAARVDREAALEGADEGDDGLDVSGAGEGRHPPHPTVTPERCGPASARRRGRVPRGPRERSAGHPVDGPARRGTCGPG